MSNVSNDQYVYGLLKEGLDASALRSKVISNNIANVNTKGYKAYHVKFEDNLKDSMDSLELKTTDPRHIKGSNKVGDIEITQDNGISMKEDGNSVDVDNEMADQASNTLNYLGLITQVSNRLAIQRYIIGDGRR